MEFSFKNVLAYVRNFFHVATIPEERSRKRRGSNLEPVLSPKISRFAPYNTKTRIIPIVRQTEDSPHWFARTDSSIKKSPLQRTFPRKPMRPIRVVDTVTLDDDDDEVIEVRKPGVLKPPGRGKVSTSTPTDSKKSVFMNGNNEIVDDDVSFVKETKSPNKKREEARSVGFNYIESCYALSDEFLNMDKSAAPNDPKPKTRVSPASSRCPPGGPKGQSVLDLSDRLDAKRKYQQLLDGARGAVPSPVDVSYRPEDKLRYKKLLASGGSLSDASVYRTPTGRLFSSYDAANALARSPVGGERPARDRPRETTRQCIMKVLDGMGDEPCVVKDSDSEDGGGGGDVAVVCPPSPKPDIKVDPVNSFRKIVDTSRVARRDWLDDMVERHKRQAEERQRQIDDLREWSQKQADINRDINVELLRRKVNDCLQLRDVILPEVEGRAEVPELPPLTDKHLAIVQRAFRGDPGEVLARKFNLNITRRDLMTLAGLNWLNDEVINFYMNLIVERGKDPRWPKSYAFNTFFYTKLIKDGPQSLRRWTKKVDLFAHDLICVPIHLGMHWCMAIVDFRDKSIRYYDSMGSPNNKCLHALRNYLEAEHADKKGCRYDTRDFRLENARDIPQQMNGSDCGMFACTFAEFVSRNARIAFGQEDMPYLRKKMVVEIVLGDFLIK